MTILAATDFSDQSAVALRQAAHLARTRGAELLLLHSVESAAGQPAFVQAVEGVEDLEAQWRQGALSRMADFVDEHLSAEERPDEIAFRADLEVAEESIENTLRSEDFELVVLGATGENRLSTFFLGSTPEAVARRSDVPVLVVPESGRVGDYESIVAPVDFTRCSRKSLARAVSFARAYDARLTILHAYQVRVAESSYFPGQISGESLDTLREQSEERFREFVESNELREVDWETRHEPGAPPDVVVEVVEDADADLVVMGTHGRRGLERFFLGSTATKVLRRMPCSVMTVRHREEEG